LTFLQDLFNKEGINTSDGQEQLVRELHCKLNPSCPNVESGVRILLQVLKHVAAFPLETNHIASPLTADDCFRALGILAGCFKNSTIDEPGRLGRYDGLWVSRERSEPDLNRMLFRALAQPKKVASNNDFYTSRVDKSNIGISDSSNCSRYRRLPVLYFEYEVLNDRILSSDDDSWKAIHILQREDERTVDVSDCLTDITSEKYVKYTIENKLDNKLADAPAFWRLAYLQLLPGLGLKTYTHFLDELILTYEDLLEFVKFLLVFNYTMFPFKANHFSSDTELLQLAERTCREFNKTQEDVSYEQFYETITLSLVRLFLNFSILVIFI
jgi:hypothetical protein